jgi:sugar lactone lactonase YvrE
MLAEIFDERICSLGEGPSSSGALHSEVSWVDITGSRVLTRNLATNRTSEFSTGENVGFAIPRASGGYVLGTNSGPILRDVDGRLHAFLKLTDLEPQTSQIAIRWNDGKVSPSGNLWFGTMGYDMLAETSSLFKYDIHDSKVSRVLFNLTISNGMDWSDDGTTFYLIDSAWEAVHAFTVREDELSEERTVIEIPESAGVPDGMCIDAEGGLWVALWGGAQVRRYDLNDNFKLSQIIELPTQFITSCAFAGENLDTMIITAAQNNQIGGAKEAGMTFCIKPGVVGRPSRTVDL